MQQLAEKIAAQTGVPAPQVNEVIHAVAAYVKERYPLLSGTVDLVLNGQGSEPTSLN